MKKDEHLENQKGSLRGFFTFLVAVAHGAARYIWGATAAAGRNGNGNLHRKVVYVVVDLARAADCAPLTRCFS